MSKRKRGKHTTAIDPRHTTTRQQIVQAVSESDRDWFAKHPGIDYRVREFFPGEMSHEYKTVIVEQLASGQRVRYGQNTPLADVRWMIEHDQPVYTRYGMRIVTMFD